MTDLIGRIEGPITSPEDFALKLSDVAMVDGAPSPTGRASTFGAAGTRVGFDPSTRPAVPSLVGAAGEAPAVENDLPGSPAMTPATAAPTVRLHVAHLALHPDRFAWFCTWSWRYRRALGDSRVDALRRALACAQSHGGHT